MITHVTGKNQVTVPAEIVARAGIGAGTRLEWKMTGKKGLIEVRVLPDAAALARGLLGKGKTTALKRGSAVARLIKERERDLGAER